MKVEIKVKNGITVVAEGDKHIDMFEQIASLQEAFGQDKCGKCHKGELRYVVRKDSDDNKYYELHCQNRNCRARLSFGQNKEGGSLYPRTKEVKKQTVMGGALDAGDCLPDNGWLRWDKEKQCNV